MDASAFARAGAEDRDGANINGPSVVELPDWIVGTGRAAHPSARYYLYFAHHHGKYIRMAWASDIEGPWHLHGVGPEVAVGQRGVLDLGDRSRVALPGGFEVRGHIASPEVWIDHERERFVLYFHGYVRAPGKSDGAQRTLVATSSDGLNFNAPESGGQEGHGIRSPPLGLSYFRVFEWRGQAYAVANRGLLYRAPEGAGATDDAAWTRPWQRREAPLLEPEREREDGRVSAIRHVALLRDGPHLHVFFSRIGDAPEHILHVAVDLRPENWLDWTFTPSPSPVLAPDLPWEGGLHPVVPSQAGLGTGVRQLRDPYLFESEGRRFLFYSGSGEEGIGLAWLYEANAE